MIFSVKLVADVRRSLARPMFTGALERLASPARRALRPSSDSRPDTAQGPVQRIRTEMRRSRTLRRRTRAGTNTNEASCGCTTLLPVAGAGVTALGSGGGGGTGGGTGGGVAPGDGGGGGGGGGELPRVVTTSRATARSPSG
jgi:hypothetical protein